MANPVYEANPTGWYRSLRRVLDASEIRHLVQTKAGRVLVGAVGAIALLTVIGLLALWPYGGATSGLPPGVATTQATVERVVDRPCTEGLPDACRSIVVSVDGREATLGVNLVRLSPDLEKGDAVRVRALGGGEGTAAHYEFVEPDRRGSLLWMGLLVALLAAAVLRWRGVLAVVGVALSIGVVLWFLVPGILAGKPALLVALVAALTVMFVTLVLTNGVGAQTLAAALGISATLVLAVVVGELAAGFTNLGGITDATLSSVGSRDSSLSLREITVAAMLIGALGVLADTAVTQASAVMALRRANSRLKGRELYTRAFVVGRDHLSATIHTLVLAYAGAVLPLLLVLSSSNIATVDALNDQSIAEPIVATLVGCLALLVAVPVSTGLASLLVARVPVEDLPDAHHHH